MQKKSRRGFIRQTVALGSYAMTFWMDAPEGMAQGGPECTLPTPAAPVQFIPNEPKVVMRYSAAELGQPGRATQLANLRKGIGAVRAMPQNDVRGWTKQIAQHCIDCARPNSNNVHWNWQFVPWHRAMLYFLERIMRSQTGVDDIRLCYWDWENSASRVLPAIYAPSGQSLYWANRSSGKPNWPLSDDDVDVQPALSVPTFNLFGGTAVQRSPTPIAYSGPHASVHNAFAPGDMADLQYSPRDPVFYAHHSNIDRLWSSWVAAGHSNPDFKDAKVYFYDEKSVWRYVLMNDVRDEKKLGYQYSSLMRSASAAPANLRLTSMRRTNAASLQMDANEVATVAAKPQTPRFLLAQNIQGLDKFAADTTRFGVFDVNPAVGTDSHTDKGFLGKFSRVLSSGHEHETGPLSAALNVTGKLTGAVAANKGSLKLVVAPLDANGKTTAAGIPLGADDVSIVE